MNIQQLRKLLKEFTTKNILIIGDVMVDTYLWGNVSRISPEAPVPVVSCHNREHRMGGAANVAINVKSLGANPVIAGIIGSDENGKLFQKLLKNRKMSDIGLFIDDTRPTTVKTRIIGNHQQLLRVDEESVQFISGEVASNLQNRIISMLDKNNIDVIIFQDYDKGVITPDLFTEVAKKAKEKKIPTLVDPKWRNFSNYRNISLFKPNFKELVEGLGLDIRKNEFDQLHQAAKQIITERSIEAVMVTLSELGIFISDGSKYEVIPSEVRDVADVSGAGDTVISMAALCLACQLSLSDTARLSNLAGGIVCEKVGVVPIEPEQLLKKFSNSK